MRKLLGVGGEELGNSGRGRSRGPAEAMSGPGVCPQSLLLEGYQATLRVGGTQQTEAAGLPLRRAWAGVCLRRGRGRT